jgi:hypothetical protein
MYWVKRKIRQIKRVIDFLPLIWSGFDFDFRYSLDLFKKQLERTASFLESDKAYTLSAKTNAQKIRTAIRLIDIVYDEKYVDEFLDSYDGNDREGFKRVIEKQKRAHKLLWDFIEHNIQRWWD